MNAKLNLFVALLVLLSTVGIAGVVSASHTDSSADHIPANVNVDHESVDKYSPALVTDHLEVKPTAMYGVRISSPDWDVDAYYYWTVYTHQEGVTQADSHLGDHEPVIVFVDDSTGEVDSISYTQWHYIEGKSSSTLTLKNETHPVLRVNSPYHHYLLSTDESRAHTLETANFTTEKADTWYANEWEADADAVWNPYLFRTGEKSSWWQTGTVDGWIGKQYAEVRLYLRGLSTVSAGWL